MEYDGPEGDHACDDEDDSPQLVHWSGSQWAVTDVGLEGVFLNHREIVPADDLGHVLDVRSREPVLDNLFRIGSKTWVDVSDFLTAYEVALRLHQGRYVEPPPGTFARSADWARSRRAP